MSDVSTERSPASISVSFGKTLLVVATLALLTSIGGAMAVAAPILIPLHWFAARSSRGWRRGAWIFLAALSTWEAVWIYTYLGHGEGAAVIVIPLLVAGILTAIFGTTTNPTGSGADR